MKTVVVLAGGPDLPVGFTLPAGAVVVAADGGAEFGVPVDLAVGDFDSVSPQTLASIECVEPHPVEKDATDLELALDAAMGLGGRRIIVVGSAGGRLDHLVGSLLLLAADAYAGVQIDAQLGVAAVHVVRGRRSLHGVPRELVSLFAVNGPAVGVVTSGLVYPLDGETLEPGSSRGTSNIFAAAEAQVSLVQGVLLVVRPSGSVQAGNES